MMKKISKLALLAAATAFLLAAFPACSDDDNNNEPTPTVKPGDGEGGEGGGDVDPNTPVATARTYDFATWSAADLAAFGGEQYTDSKGSAKNTLKSPDGSTELSTGVTIYNKSANAIMIRTESTTDTTPTGLNYNGGIATSIADGVTIAELDRYVKIHVDGAGTVTASIKAVNSSGKTGTLQFALVDKDGKLIGDLVTANVADGKITGIDNIRGTVTGKVTAETDVYLVFSRNGAGGGGMDVYSIAVAPAAN